MRNYALERITVWGERGRIAASPAVFEFRVLAKTNTSGAIHDYAVRVVRKDGSGAPLSGDELGKVMRLHVLMEGEMHPDGEDWVGFDRLGRVRGCHWWSSDPPACTAVLDGTDVVHTLGAGAMYEDVVRTYDTGDPLGGGRGWPPEYSRLYRGEPRKGDAAVCRAA